MTFDLTSYRRQWFTDAAAARRDVLAGIVVALALIPEAIGFSIIAGVDPRVGLYASVAIAITISLVGGGGAGATTGAATLAANVSGGITKAGAGTLTLTAVNTYTGQTVVNQGTVLVEIK